MTKPILLKAGIIVVSIPALIGIVGGFLQLFDIVSTKATAWLMSCLIVSVTTTTTVIGIFSPIFSFYIFISVLKEKKESRLLKTIPAIIYFAVFGGLTAWMGYHSIIVLLDTFPFFINGY